MTSTIASGSVRSEVSSSWRRCGVPLPAASAMAQASSTPAATCA